MNYQSLSVTPLKRKSGTRQAYDRQIRTVCQECPQACGLQVYLQNGRIVDLEGDESHAISRGGLCARGLAFVQGLDHQDRLRRPAHRRGIGEDFHDLADWDLALDHLADSLNRLRERHGPESLVIGCDPEAGLDFYLGARRFARLWGTPHVFHPLQEPEDLAWPTVLNAPTRPCPDWIHSNCLFLIEADLAAAHPVAFQWVLEARRRGARIITADARYTATMSKADLSLFIAPASGNYLGLALMKQLLADNPGLRETLSSRLTQADSWLESLDGLSMEELAGPALVSEKDISEISRLLTRSGPVTLITGKRLAFLSYYSVWLSLAAAMGWPESGAGGWYPLESGLPPLDPTVDLLDRETQEPQTRPRAWSYQFAREYEPDHLHPVKAIIGTGDCLDDFLAPYQILMKHVDLAVYFGSFPNTTHSLSHLIFPAALWPEREGLFFSNDRAVHWGEALMEPVLDCRTGLDFWSSLAQRLGWADYFPWTEDHGPDQRRAFYDWLFQQNPLLGAGNVAGLREAGQNSEIIYWPWSEDSGASVSYPFHGQKIKPVPIHLPPGSDEDAARDYPLLFQTTRLVTRSGEAGRHRPWTADLEDEEVVQIHPDTAQALGLENGDQVVVSGPGMSMTGRARLSRISPPWLVWSPRRLGGKRVLLHKPGVDRQAARDNLIEFLSGAGHLK